jgi:hypothetical protein
MSRRTAGLAALAATVVVGGFVPALMGGASAASHCPTWSDASGDASRAGLPNPTGHFGDRNLDIVDSGLTTTATTFSAAIRVDRLNQTASDAGDEFAMHFTVNGKALVLYAKRPLNGLRYGTVPTGEGAGIYNSTAGTDAPGRAKAVFDVSRSTVTISATVAAIEAAAGVPVVGRPLSAIKSTASDQVSPGPTLRAEFDESPTTLPATMGGDCGGTPAPVPVPVPPVTTTGSVIPEATPGCLDLADGRGDAPASSALGGNDADLDITGAVFRTTADRLITYVLVDDLATRPEQAPGHAFYSEFTLNGKAVSILAATYDPSVVGDARNGGSATGVLAPTSQLRVNNTYQPASVVDATFDTGKDLVTLSVRRADLARATGSAFTPGTVLSAVRVRSTADFGGISPAGGDAAGGGSRNSLAVDTNTCFGPPPAVITNVGATTSQYGDPAQLAARLTSSRGAALTGRPVTFALAGRSVVATTNGSGVASASIPLNVPAGPLTLTIGYSGDSATGRAAVSLAFTVTPERTKLILSASKRENVRTVTARLVDDDNQPLAGQVLEFSVNGKLVATLTTSWAGTASYTKSNPSQSVKVTFAAVPDKYLGTNAQLRL